MTRVERDPARLFARPQVTIENRPDGSRVLRSPVALGTPDRCIGDWLVRWAAQAPDRVFVAERDGQGGWRRVTYAQALAQVESLAACLLEMGLHAQRPLAVLSDNGVEHALLMLAAMHAGVPYASVSPAYSLMSTDHAKLKSIIDQLTPGLLYVARSAPFAAALAALRGRHTARVVVGSGDPATRGQAATDGTWAAWQASGAGDTEPIAFESLVAPREVSAARAAFAAVAPSTIAKLLFTSGSTGTPKGVINTHAMLCSNQQAKAQVWPFLASSPPTIVDWLPWSHTFGGNHNFNLVLRNGGTLYVDGGRPMPGLIDTSVANLKDQPPTLYFNVPRGFDLLIGALRQDAELRQRFFSRLQVAFYAAAALPQSLWDALTEMALATVGEPIAMVSAWGSTETSPLATDCHFQAPRSGIIGVPIPGTELKLVPNGDKQEIRVRGPNVMPGYWRNPALSAQAFDADGFYQIGDAVRLADPADASQGLVFDGRVAEDFKLTSGTWVNVGSLRLRAVEALAPLAQDVVVCGHDRAEVRLLVFVNPVAARALAGAAADAPIDAVITAPAVRDRVRLGLQRLGEHGEGSSMQARAALLMTEPPNIDAGEITDKAYVNQRAVLNRRAPLVARLYGNEGPDIVTLA